MNIQAFAAIGLYAFLNSVILWWIAVKTGQVRARHKVWMGDGGVPHIIRVLRGHANAIENVPMFFVTMMLGVILGAPVLAIHLLGVVFTLGRFLHMLHFMAEDAPRWQRGIGYGLSFLAWFLAALGVLGHSVMALWA